MDILPSYGFRSIKCLDIHWYLVDDLGIEEVTVQTDQTMHED